MDRFPVSDDVTYTVSEEEMMPQSAVGLNTDMRLPKGGARYVLSCMYQLRHVCLNTIPYVSAVGLSTDMGLPKDDARYVMHVSAAAHMLLSYVASECCRSQHRYEAAQRRRQVCFVTSRSMYA